MSQQEVWDTLSVDWAKFRSVPQESVKEFLSDKKGLILDIGCGTGRNLIEGKNFVAIDPSKNMMHIAHRKLIFRDDIHFARADGVVLPFKSQKFETAMAISTLHAVYKKNHAAMLKEISRVLKPGGCLLLTVWSKNQPRFFFKKKESFVKWKIGERDVRRYYYLFTKNELKKLLGNNGFEVIEIRGSKKKNYGFSSDIIAIARKKK